MPALESTKRIPATRGVATLVKLMEPARSWWPQVGCTILQTTAAAASATLCKLPAARKKVHDNGGVPALVNLLTRGSAEAQSHAAVSVGLLAESARLAFEVRRLSLHALQALERSCTGVCSGDLCNL